MKGFFSFSFFFFLHSIGWPLATARRLEWHRDNSNGPVQNWVSTAKISRRGAHAEREMARGAGSRAANRNCIILFWVEGSSFEPADRSHAHGWGGTRIRPNDQGYIFTQICIMCAMYNDLYMYTHPKGSSTCRTLLRFGIESDQAAFGPYTALERSNRLLASTYYLSDPVLTEGLGMLRGHRICGCS
jgi:hypothetical protein